MQKIVKKSVVPIYSLAVLWVLWAVMFPLYKISHFIILAIISLVVYFIMQGMVKGEITEIAEKPVLTGNDELDALILQRDAAIVEMRRLNDNIENAYISQKIDELEEVTAKIFGIVIEKPQKAIKVKKFMSYYLPTTLKMLDTYDKMSDAGLDGENIDATKKKISGIMDTIIQAFHKQLDSLYGDEALDISTDITVLENMLVREGLTDQQLKPQ